MKRNITIDLMKGFGIILMIFGHYGGINPIVRNFIFSFHMPLFFIVSGYFFKPVENSVAFNKGVKNLCVPYFLTAITIILLCLFIPDFILAKNQIIGMFMSNGGHHSEIWGRNLPFCGPIWFLLALFWCKYFYNVIKKHVKVTFLYTFTLSIIAFLIGKYVVNLPFGILTGICGLVFYDIGIHWKQRGNIPIGFNIIGIGIWLICIFYGKLEIFSFDLSLYPISIIGAFIGTYNIYMICKHIPDIIKPLLLWAGRNTLLILCYHTLAFYVIMMISSRSGLTFGYNKALALNISITLIATKVHLSIKKAYSIKKNIMY